jgi:hypothetical protein
MSVFKRLSYLWGAGLSSSARMTSWVAAFAVFGVWYYVDHKMANYSYKKIMVEQSINISGKDNESSSPTSESSKSKSECAKSDCGCSGDNKKTDSAGR